MIAAYQEIYDALQNGLWTCHRDGVRVGADELTINPGSVNVTLGNIALAPTRINWSHNYIDLHRDDTLEWRADKASAFYLNPGTFFLMHVRERFDCSAPLTIGGQQRYFAPMIEGRSTVARCGLSIHATAGFGDYGFNANFTLELTTALPIILRPGDEIAQIAFVEVSSPTRYESVYADQFDAPRAPVLGRHRFQRESP